MTAVIAIRAMAPAFVHSAGLSAPMPAGGTFTILPFEPEIPASAIRAKPGKRFRGSRRLWTWVRR